jgi:hypothetical protein
VHCAREQLIISNIHSKDLYLLISILSAHESVSVVFTISFKSRAAMSNDIKSALKDSTNKNIPSIEVGCSALLLRFASLLLSLINIFLSPVCHVLHIVAPAGIRASATGGHQQ